MISGTTALVALLGQPVSHSLSPVMQNAALKAMGLDWSFMALPCSADDLASVLKGLEAVGCRGLNVTIPHKQAVSLLCEELSPLAQRLGAVNTLTPLPRGGWDGHNTDVEAFSPRFCKIIRTGAEGEPWWWVVEEAPGRL